MLLQEEGVFIQPSISLHYLKHGSKEFDVIKWYINLFHGSGMVLKKMVFLHGSMF